MTSEELQKFIAEIKEDISVIKNNLDLINWPANEIALDDVDLQKLLNVSKRTTAQWRKEGLLTFYKPSGKIFYYRSDIFKMLEKAKISATKNAVIDYFTKKRTCRKSTKK